MSGLFYPRLALRNLAKNRSTYLPYLLTGTVCVAMYYIMQSISMNEGLMQVPGAAVALAIFWLGTVVIGIFCVILIFYTNSFLIKRRRAEFGLYCVLGMEKRHVALVLFFETLFTALCCLSLGIALGALLSKLLFLALLYVMDIATPLAFAFSVPSAATACGLFLCIYGATLLYNLWRIRVSRPVELLSSSHTGEREPKASWFLVVVGVLSLAWGYYTAVTVNDPLNALLLFFLAVLAVILGTFCLFTAGSIALLKWMKKRKNYYYTPEHFISVSGMMYRMKQNAAGLAAICILFTMVLVTVSTTVCLYTGRDEMLYTQYPMDLRGTVTLAEGVTMEQLDAAVDSAVQQGGSLVEKRYMYRDVHTTVRLDETGAFHKADGSNTADSGLKCISLADYQAYVDPSATLAPGEVLAWSTEPLRASYTFGGSTYLARPLALPQELETFYRAYGSKLYVLVVPDYETALALQTAIAPEAAPGTGNSVTLFLNVSGSPDQQASIEQALVDYTPEGMAFRVFSRATAGKEWGGLYGSFLFLGLYLGSMFMLATVLIIYYKQLSEGYDDRERFIILQQVGMSQKEVKRTISKQVLTVFFLPLLMALVHMLFAFNIIANIMVVFSMTNRVLFGVVCAVIFAVFSLVYLGVYRLTSHTYYKLVKT